VDDPFGLLLTGSLASRFIAVSTSSELDGRSVGPCCVEEVPVDEDSPACPCSLNCDPGGDRSRGGGTSNLMFGGLEGDGLKGGGPEGSGPEGGGASTIIGRELLSYGEPGDPRNWKVDTWGGSSLSCVL
jgi:hypothetical protein